MPQFQKTESKDKEKNCTIVPEIVAQRKRHITTKNDMPVFPKYLSVII